MKNSGKVNYPTMRPRALALAVAAACAVMGQQAQADIITFTGNAPVFVGTWYNGFYTEKHEFQYLLDWQGYCNAHIGAVCSANTYWGSANNWSASLGGNGLPTANDAVNTPVGSVVSIHSYNSTYQGYIGSMAYAGTLNAMGQIHIGSGELHTDAAYIDNLNINSNGLLVNNGLVTVGTLSGAYGHFNGTGKTIINTAAAPVFPDHTFIDAGHTVEVMSGNFGARMYAQSKLITHGTYSALDLGLQGSANANTLPVYVNKGTITGPLSLSAVSFNNDGLVDLDDATDSLSVIYNGTHTGTFRGVAGSVMGFKSYGGGKGHDFLGGSEISTDGKVTFTGYDHTMAGQYRAHETEVASGEVIFSGNTSFLDIVTLNANGVAAFETLGGVDIDILNISGGGARFTTRSGDTSTANTVNLLSGSLNAGTPLTISGLFTWNSGNVSGTVNADGGIEINSGTASHGLYGVLRNPGVTNWNGGGITGGGTFENLVGATFNVNGDFSAGSGGIGHFRNAKGATFIKTAGNGTASIGMAFHNDGLVQVDAGTLQLNGGGTHDGGRFEAMPGTLIELSGATTLKGAVTTVGRVDITGGSLTLLSGASFTNALGNSINVSALSTESGTTFVSHGGFNVSGTLENQGTFTLHPSSSVGALVNGGTFDSQGGLSIGGDFANSGTFTGQGTNSGPLNSQGYLFIGGGLTNTGTLNNQGDLAVNGDVDSSGSFINSGAVEFYGQNVAFSGAGTNSVGSIYNGGSNFTVVSGTSVTNNGSFVNDYGTVYVQAGAYLGGAGNYVQTGGLTNVKGVLQADAGIDIQEGTLTGTGTIIGNVTLGQYAQWMPGNTPGTMTVNGDVTINGTTDYFYWDADGSFYDSVQYDGNGNVIPSESNIELEFDSPTVHDRIVVSGAITFNAASIDLVFAPGFTVQDGDSFDWLSAGQVDGASNIVYNISGLSPEWQATSTFGTNGLSLELTNLQAVAIPVLGSYRINAGDHAYNDVSWAHLDDLSIAGNLSNRVGGELNTSAFNVELGGRLLNRAAFNASGGANAGTMINRTGGSMSIGAFSNNGTIINEGVFYSSQGLTNLAGARFENRGEMNADYSEIVNHGEFFVAGTLDSSAPYRGPQYYPAIKNYGVFTVAGTLNNNTESLGPTWYTGSISNQTAYDNDYNIVSSGKFIVERGGEVRGAGTYFQLGDGTETRVDGVLAASDITILGGTLTGSGTLVGPVTLSTTVKPGNSPGTLTIDGTLNANYAIFDIELAGPGSYDQLVVTGDAHFTGGTVNFLLHTPDGISYDYLPAVGDSFTWLTVGGTVEGLDGLSWNLMVVGDGWYTTVASNGWVSDWWANDTGLKANFNGTSLEFTAAVPEPETWAMLLAGLGLIAARVGNRARKGNLAAV